MNLFFPVATMSLVTLGLACLALAMERHHRPLPGLPKQLHRRLWRLSGILLLALALWAASAGWGMTIGAVLWTGLLPIGTLAVAILDARRGRLMPPPTKKD